MNDLCYHLTKPTQVEEDKQKQAVFTKSYSRLATNASFYDPIQTEPQLSQKYI